MVKKRINKKEININQVVSKIILTFVLNQLKLKTMMKIIDFDFEPYVMQELTFKCGKEKRRERRKKERKNK